jgi:hypothetical protein
MLAIRSCPESQSHLRRLLAVAEQILGKGEYSSAVLSHRRIEDSSPHPHRETDSRPMTSQQAILRMRIAGGLIARNCFHGHPYDYSS